MTTSPYKQCRICSDVFPATSDYFYTRSSSKDGLRNECKTCLRERDKARYAANPEKYRAKQHDYWENHREEYREYYRQWRARNPDKLREKNRRYYAKSRDKQLEANRRWYYANRERRLEQTKAYAKARPRQTAQYQRKYRESQRGKNTRRQWYIANKRRVAEYGQQWYRNNYDKHLERTRRWRENNREKSRALWHRYRARKLAADGQYTPDNVAQQYVSQNGRCWWCGKLVGNTYHVDHRIPLSRGGSNAPENLVISCPACNCSKGAKLPHEWNGRLL